MRDIYYIYLYNDRCNERSNSQYGYWSGKSYTFHGNNYPVCENEISKYKRKGYKSLKRAICGGKIAQTRYSLTLGFDVEDENGNIVYKSYESMLETDKTKSLVCNENSHNHKISKEVGNEKRIIMVAVIYIEEVPNSLSDREIDEYLDNKYFNKKIRWYEGDKGIFDDFS